MLCGGDGPEMEAIRTPYLCGYCEIAKAFFGEMFTRDYKIRKTILSLLGKLKSIDLISRPYSR